MTGVPSSFSPGLERTGLQRLGAGGLVAIEAAALAVVTGAWAIPQALTGRPPFAWGVAASCALMVALVVTLLVNSGVLAMALQTFAQCVRMKVAVAFIVLLTIALAILPSQMKGDGTLPGAIRSLLEYGVSVIALLLSIVTVVLATRVISDDVYHKQIFLTATKPLARWQYVLGRWLGVVLLDALLLGLGMGTVFVLAQHLRGQSERLDSVEARAEERRSVETEIFTARAKAYPDPIDEANLVSRRLDAFRERGTYAAAVESFRSRTLGDVGRAEQAFQDEVRKQVLGELNSAGPGEMMFWSFSGIHVSQGRLDFPGTVDQVDRRAGQIRLKVEPQWASKMVYATPMHVDDVDGRVVGSGEDFLVLQFYSNENFQRLGLSNLLGRQVRVNVDPPVQLTYKATATGDLKDDVLTCNWALYNPQTNAIHQEPRRDPASRPNTLTVSSRVVDSTGRVNVVFQNLTSTSVHIDPADVYILYAEGSFEPNYVRATLLMLLQLAFLAALGVVAGSFLSFPVAMLMSMTFLAVALGRPMLTSALLISSVFAPGIDLFTRVAYVLLQIMNLLLPNFASTWPSDDLVDGIYISWTRLGETACLTVGIRALAALALGCLIFRKRELARVQV